MSTEEPPAASEPVMSTTDTAHHTPALTAEYTTFDAFYREHYRSLVGLSYVLTGNRWTAEDTAQDAFAAAFRSWKKVSAYESPAAWVRRVACNRSVSAIRSRIRESMLLTRLAGGRVREDIRLEDDDASFWQAVRRLPARQAQAVALFYFDDMSVQQIAAVLDCSEGAVKTHLSRGRDAVAKQLHMEKDDE